MAQDPGTCPWSHNSPCQHPDWLWRPHLRYVSKVIENRMLEKGGVNTRAGQARQSSSPDASLTQAPAPEETAKVSRKVLKDYYDYIRKTDEGRYKARIAEVTGKVPAVKDIFSEETQINAAVITLRPGPESREKRQKPPMMS